VVVFRCTRTLLRHLGTRTFAMAEQMPPDLPLSERRHGGHVVALRVVNVTAHPYAAWAAQQIVEAVGPDANVVRLIRDRDGIYGGPSTRECETLASNSCAPRQDAPGRTDTRNGG
jgi:hypothetical protein